MVKDVNFSFGPARQISFKTLVDHREDLAYTYLAGPISGREKKNWPAFFEVEQAIGHMWCLTPHRINSLIVNNEILPDEQILKDETTYFRASVNSLLNHAKSIVLIRDWQESQGAMAEYLLAKRLGLPAFEVVYYHEVNKTIDVPGSLVAIR